MESTNSASKNKLFHRTMEALEESLHCGLIATDLDLQAGVKDLNAHDEEILDFALKNRFTRIPLRSKEQGPHGAITHVAIIDLGQGRLAERREITVDDVISASTPIERAVKLLRRRRFYFVLDPDQILKILTVSDVNRLPMRTYLHTLLDHLEGLMTECIEKTFPDEGWMSHLSDSRKQEVRSLHAQKQSQDFDTRLIDCTTFSDKMTILRKADVLPTEDSRSAFQRKVGPIRQLRNRLGHGMPAIDHEIDRLRDHQRHGNQLVKAGDLDWLGDTIETLRNLIDALSANLEEPPR